jgi:hypothetical protein
MLDGAGIVAEIATVKAAAVTTDAIGINLYNMSQKPTFHGFK